ncbi:MAG: hypothetical protein COA78_22005 [Blastopirellula sp.]|nr:MAG: hypothetical protein COA78_22005 [Blastopirellula sp.]
MSERDINELSEQIDRIEEKQDAWNRAIVSIARRRLAILEGWGTFFGWCLIILGAILALAVIVFLGFVVYEFSAPLLFALTWLGYIIAIPVFGLGGIALIIFVLAKSIDFAMSFVKPYKHLRDDK